MEPAMNAYRDRWLALQEIELLEQRSATVAMRWRQLNTIYGMAKALGLLRPDDAEGEIAIRLRWQRLAAGSGKS